MISIKNDQMYLSFNNVGYNCIVGTDYNCINRIINGIDGYFSSKREVDIPFSLLDGDLKLNKKDYVYLKVSPLIHSNEEIEIGKTSYLRKIISDLIDNLDEEFNIYDKLTRTLTEEFSKNDSFDFSKLSSICEDIKNINLEFSIAQINKKMFLDSILCVNFLKNNKEGESLTNYEISMVVLNVLKILLSFNLDKKVLILIDNIEYKMNEKEKKNILKKIYSLCDERCCVLHFAEDILEDDEKIVFGKLNIINDSILSGLLDDRIIRDLQDSYPAHLEYENLIELYMNFIMKYHRFLSKSLIGYVLSDLNIEEKRILFALNDVFRLDIDNIL